MEDNRTSKGLLCPTCRVDLVMSERQGIEIDYCPQCRGVWLDRGELDKIIERSVADDGVRPLGGRLGMFDEQRGHGDQHGHGGHGGKHGYERGGHGRRKGFLRELFD
ncbi:TFIIB-type zinc ribbon-containing protein [Sphingobium cloacae]|uniref:TFIIB-type zinc ribbon-containing protein n=2 Tax=Sphingobium cloacae TaxID=120107 RepID=UPI0009FC856D|nr:zf-TFIIB domain-containing protein [Sphingobium cloacae]